MTNLFEEYNYLPNILEAVYANYTYVIQFAMVNPKNLRVIG